VPVASAIIISEVPCGAPFFKLGMSADLRGHFPIYHGATALELTAQDPAEQTAPDAYRSMECAFDDIMARSLTSKPGRASHRTASRASPGMLNLGLGPHNL